MYTINSCSAPIRTEMNFPTSGPSEVISPMLLFAPFYQPLKMPLAVDESRIYIYIFFPEPKLFAVQPWPQARGVSSVVMPFTSMCLM